MLPVAKRKVHFLAIRPWGSICSCIERASSSRVKSSTMHNLPLSPQMGLPGVGGLVSQQQLFARPPMMAGLPGQQGKPPPAPPLLNLCCLPSLGLAASSSTVMASYGHVAVRPVGGRTVLLAHRSCCDPWSCVPSPLSKCISVAPRSRVNHVSSAVFC